MSFLTCSWALPQKEHFSWPFSSPNLNIISPRGCGRLRSLPQHAVENAVLQGLLCGHVEVAVGIPLDPLDGLSGVPGQDVVEGVLDPEDLPRLDLDLRGLTPGPSQRLVDHHARVRQGEPFALGTGRQENGG